MNHWINLALVGAAVAVAASAAARPGPTSGEPSKFADLRSIGDVVAQAKSGQRPVHIVYLHGMRAEQSGASDFMIAALLASPMLKDFAKGKPTRTKLAIDARPAGASYAGNSLWQCDPEDQQCHADWDEAWDRSTPFVVRTELAGPTGNFKVIVHEVNWWPLLLGLKCRQLVAPDAFLSGAASKQIEICARDWSDPAKDRYFPWLSADRARELLDRRPPLGRGALANRYIKQSILNWGMADAIITLGPMGHYVRQAINDAASRVTTEAPDMAEHILVAESLGGFVAMDAARELPKALELVERTRHFYFLANQFGLLELGRIKGLAGTTPTLVPHSSNSSPLEILAKHAGTKAARVGLVDVAPTQIVAISDPSDMLTYRVPEMKGIAVSNVQWRFSGGPFNLWAHPLNAHRGGIETPRVWRWLLKRHSEPGAK